VQKKRFLSLNVLLVGIATAVTMTAAEAGAQFSADMLQHGPEGQSVTGKMAVGDGRIRTEMVHQGQLVVRITDENRGVEWILFPEQKRYMERRLPGTDGKAPVKPSAEDPCANMPGLTCKKAGEEEVSGRTAVVWEIIAYRQGKAMKGMQWIDVERGASFILRQELPTGQKMERTLLGQDVLDERQTEKWRIEMTRPDGQTISTLEWYDPELDIAIKQELPGGGSNELSNIRVGPQPDHLFGIPAGYERMAAPQMPGQPPRR